MLSFALQWLSVEGDASLQHHHCHTGLNTSAEGGSSAKILFVSSPAAGLAQGPGTWAHIAENIQTTIHHQKEEKN